MFLLIDNYDSFTFNLYQMIGAFYNDIKVVRNDALTIEDIEKMKLAGIIISPGPGRPEKAGICIDVIKSFAGRLPILGICLGHQAIAHAFGGQIIRAEKIMHGKTSELYTEDSLIFKGLPRSFNVMRYHSLVVEANSLPEELEVIAKQRTRLLWLLSIRATKYMVCNFILNPYLQNTVKNIKKFCRGDL